MRDQDLPSQEPAPPAAPARLEAAFAKHKDQPKSTGRRQFLKTAALASAPVILTVASRPAWGADICTPSGMASGNASSTQDPMECMTGDGPNTRAAAGVNSWPSPYNVTNIRFDDVFGVGPTQQLIQVLNGTGGGTYTPLHRASVAALLNAADGLMPYLGLDPVAVVICIVNEALTNHSYQVLPNGYAWTEDQVLAYFEMTFATP